MLWLFSLIRWAGDVVIFNFDQKSDQLRVQWLPSFSGYLFPIQVFKTAYVGFQYPFSVHFCNGKLRAACGFAANNHGYHTICLWTGQPQLESTSKASNLRQAHRIEILQGTREDKGVH